MAAFPFLPDARNDDHVRLLAHAVIRVDGELPETSAHVRWVCVGGLAVACTPAKTDTDCRDVALALEHAKLVAQLHARQTVIPLRFGTLIRSPEELTTIVTKRLPGLRAALDALDGCEEFEIQIGPSAALENPRYPVDRTETSGLQYMLRRRAEVTERERIDRETVDFAERIRAALSSVCIRFIVDEFQNQTATHISLHCLALRGMGAALRQKLSGVVAPAAVLAHLSGPWPLYRFFGEMVGQSNNDIY